MTHSSFSLLVFMLEFLYEINAADSALLVNLADISAFYSGFSSVTISEVTYAEFSASMTVFISLFAQEFQAQATTAVTVVNTEVNFLNLVALSEVSWGKFCEGFISNKDTFTDTFECTCEESFVSSINEANSKTVCGCADGFTQVDGACVETAEAELQTVVLTGDIVTAYEYSAELADTSSTAFAEAAATVQQDLVVVMSRSVKVTTVVVTVTGFVEEQVGRRRRADETGSKAKAEYEAEVEAPAEDSTDDIIGDISDTVENASDDGFDSLDTDSFASAKINEPIPDPTPAAATVEDDDCDLALKIFFPILAVFAIVGIVIVALKCQKNPKMLAILLGTVRYV